MNKETQFLYQITSSAATLKIKCLLTEASPHLEKYGLVLSTSAIEKGTLK